MSYFHLWITMLGLVLHSPTHPSPKDSDRAPIVIQRAYVNHLEQASIAFDRAGTIKELFVKQGDYVQADVPLVQLDDSVASRAHAIAVAKAESLVAIAFAKVVHDGSRAELEAMMQANQVAKGTYSLTDIERLRIETEKAKLQIKQAEEERHQAILTRNHSAAELLTYQIRAPFDGRISKIHISKGDSIQQGEKILELVEESKFRVQGYVPLSKAWSIAAGDQITVRVTDPAISKVLKRTEFEGKLERISLSIETVRGVVAVTGIVENTEGDLKDGLEVELIIHPSNCRE